MEELRKTEGRGQAGLQGLYKSRLKRWTGLGEMMGGGRMHEKTIQRAQQRVVRQRGQWQEGGLESKKELGLGWSA